MRGFTTILNLSTDVEGTLIASSPIISLNKEVMGLSGLLQDGRTLPAPAMLTIPISTVIPREDALIIDDTIIKGQYLWVIVC